MYDFVDQPVERLCNGGRFLLWAMRGWSHAKGRSACAPIALARGFTGVDALAALNDFNAVMALLNRDALETLQFSPMGCARIAEDEAILSNLWRDAALGRRDRVEATLGLLVEEQTVAQITLAVTATVAKLAAAGLDPAGALAEVQKDIK
ncbi:MAG: hypothetical protein QM676_07470 [Novosphingobium sp.]